MKDQEKSANFLRERRFFTALPLLVLPFLTLFFWALGGGKVQDTVASQENKKEGLNAELPAPQFKEDREMDKLSFYQMAASDSARLLQQQRRDPYLVGNDRYPDTEQNSTHSGYYRSPVGNAYPTSSYSDPNEQKVYDKLAALDRSLNSPAPTGQAPIVPSPETKAVAQADIDRLEGLMEKMRSTDQEEDPEIGELSRMMETILDIQHPERVQHRLLEESEKNKGQVYTVSTLSRPVTVSLLDKNAGSRKDSVQLLAEAANGFYSLEDSPEREIRQNAIRAVVHEDQTVVSGATVKFRLLDNIVINGVEIPKNTFVFGEAALSGDRLNCVVKSISYGNSIYPVNLDVFAPDGISGIHIRGAISRDVSRQSGDRAIQRVGTTGIGTSLETQALGAAIEGSRNLFSKKLKLIEVNLKADDIVLLKDRQQKE